MAAKSTGFMESDLLSTGEVARICGVTSDTVLKWIKKGRLPAVRTTGGHFRVARRTLETLGYFEKGAVGRAGVAAPISSGPVLNHCWEHFCRDLPPPESCKKCIVYRARIEKCYEVSELGETIGHGRQFCRTTCQNCSFFRACHGLAPNVLVVTSDEALIGRLTAQAASASVVLRLARSGYESSTVVETFHPSAVVMDSALPEMRDGRMVDSVLQDERMLGVKVIVALRKGDQMTARPGASVMPAPFTLAKIERLVQASEHGADVDESVAS